MSVAFRRESDEEHLEPTFELPIPAGPNLVTARGLEQIRARVGDLEARLAEAADEAATKALRRELRYWGTRQATAEVQDKPAGTEVAFGCTVTFRRGGTARTITIVGHDEADPGDGRIAFSAPLSQAMMGAELGDWVELPGRGEEIEILRIAVPMD